MSDALRAILENPCAPGEFHAQVRARLRARQERTARAPRALLEQALHCLPEYEPRLRSLAQQALEGRLILPGTGGELYAVGNPPAWHERRVPDDEYVWSLNRMFPWQELSTAYLLTGEARYAQRVVAELRDWIARCPRPALEGGDFLGVHPWRALEVGIRMFCSWPSVLEPLLTEDALPPDDLAAYAVSVHAHGEVLRNVSPRLWPRADHNHYLMENLGLLTLAVNFPEFKAAAEWQAHAIRELERCAAAQLTAEGGQIEGCPHYHDICVYFFCQAIILARQNGCAFSRPYEERVLKSVEYALHTFRPSGTIVPWGDSDSDRSAVEAVIYGYLAFGRTDFVKLAEQLCGAGQLPRTRLDGTWNTVDQIAALDGLKLSEARPAALPRAAWFRELKQAALRTGWDGQALSVFFACRTPVNNGHAHIDPAGFDFTALGKPMLVDPGRFCYRNDDDRKTFKSAAWHNTLTVDGRDPFAYIDSWGLGPQKHGDILALAESPGLSAAVARHMNYEPAVHWRLVALLGAELLLVLDRLDNLSPQSSVQLYYHFDFTRVAWDAAARTARTGGPGPNAVLCAAGPLSGEVLPGRVSDVLDVERPSRRLKLSDVASRTAERAYAAVIVPYGGAAAPAVEQLQLRREGSSVGVSFRCRGKPYELTWRDQDVALKV